AVGKFEIDTLNRCVRQVPIRIENAGNVARAVEADVFAQYIGIETLIDKRLCRYRIHRIQNVDFVPIGRPLQAIEPGRLIYKTENYRVCQFGPQVRVSARSDGGVVVVIAGPGIGYGGAARLLIESFCETGLAPIT